MNAVIKTRLLLEACPPRSKTCIKIGGEPTIYEPDGLPEAPSINSFSMTVNILEDDAYIGVIQSINDYESMKPADILDDLEESHDNVGLELKDTGKVQPDDDPAIDMSTLLDSIKEVSKGVSEKTGQEYGRYV
ncbi:hypothetical protein HHX47_DHR2000977 [Lentinula edodes]|nr:hypothetical protein HHX47_DHR2000977 [Lentinula edodes]